MSLLLGLSNELLYRIIDQIHPGDIINFSLSRKEIYLLAKDAVSLHLQRKRLYKEVTIHGCLRHEHNRHPLELLRDICMDWRIGEYPKFLTVQCCYRPFYPDNSDEEMEEIDDKLYEVEKREDEIICQQNIQAFQDSIEDKATASGFQDLDYIGREYSYDGEAHIKSFNLADCCIEALEGNRDAMLALLLFFLPNLKTLCLAQSSWDARYVESAVHWISSQSRQRNPRARKLLTNLSHVRLQGSSKDNSSEARECFEALIPFAALPSMRKLSGYWVESSRLMDTKSMFPYHTSNVTEINLNCSAISVEHLTNLLIGIKALRRFCYDYADIYDGDREGMEVHKIVAALLEHAKHSLEYLALIGSCDHDREEDVVDNQGLQGFEVLSKIYLYDEVYHWLLPNPALSPGDGFDRTKYRPLVNVLPSSIEAVSIRGLSIFNFASDVLAYLGKEKDLRLPKLTSITFVGSIPEDREMAEQWRGMCERKGITLTLETDDDTDDEDDGEVM